MYLCARIKQSRRLGRGRRTDFENREMKRRLEICAATIVSALNAQKAGADRIELCSVLAAGGVTPSCGTIRTAREKLNIDINVLIRPRPWDFVYNDAEAEEIIRDIEFCADMKVNGVVIGALTPEGEVDKYLTREWIRYAHKRGLSFTYHRAIDCSVDIMQATSDVMELGADRILSSGGCANAFDGKETLRRMVQIAGDRTIIMPGSGINPDNIAQIAEYTGARELHFSASAKHEPVMKQFGGIAVPENQVHSDEKLIALARQRI